MLVQPRVAGSPDYIGTIRLHPIDFPTSRSIGSEEDSFFSLVNSQIRKAVIESLVVVAFAVRQVDGAGAVLIGYEDVPVSVPVAGKGEAAAIGRPCRVAVFSRVIGNIRRRSCRSAIGIQGDDIDFEIAVPVGNKGDRFRPGRNGWLSIISFVIGQSSSNPTFRVPDKYVELTICPVNFGESIGAECDQSEGRH